MPDHDAPVTPSEGLPLTRRSDKVDTPQQYATWREYAFSDAPEEERNAHPGR